MFLHLKEHRKVYCNLKQSVPMNNKNYYLRLNKSYYSLFKPIKLPMSQVNQYYNLIQQRKIESNF